MIHPLDEPVDIALTVDDVMMMRAGLRQYLLYWQRHVEEDGGVTHSEQEHAEVRNRVGQLIWRLERATASPGSRIQHSAEAVRPPDATGPPDVDPSAWADQPQRPPQPWDGHAFSVERQLPSGRWVGVWTRATKQTVAWRGMCSCGWRSSEISGGKITGDPATGVESEQSREAVYDWWNEHHVPGFEERQRGG